jgi:hypothetical protein
VAFLIDANSTATSLMTASEHGPFAVSRHPDLPRTPHMHRSACYPVDVTRAVHSYGAAAGVGAAGTPGVRQQSRHRNENLGASQIGPPRV